MVSEAESIDRPLRLGVDEASALLVALRMLAELPGMGDRSALSRTIAKLEAAAGAAAAASAQVAVQVDDRDRGTRRWPQVTDALSRGRRLHLSYYVPGRDEATERDVDPMRLLVVEGRSYLEGWCRRAEAVRLFRLDRMLASRCWTCPPRCRPRPSRSTWTRACSGRRRGTSGSCWSWPPRAAGWPSTTPASEVDRAGRRPAAGQPAHPGHPVGAPAGAAAGRGRPGDRAARCWPSRSSLTPTPALAHYA